MWVVLGFFWGVGVGLVVFFFGGGGGVWLVAL